MARKRKFQKGDWAQLNDKAPKTIREEFGNFATGEVTEFRSYGWGDTEYTVRFKVNGKNRVISMKPVYLDPATPTGNVVEATIAKLKKQKAEIEERLEIEEEKLLFMRGMNMNEYDETLHKAVRIVDIVSNMGIPREQKAQRIKELLSQKS